jgi:hypothetical protein
MGLKTDPVSVDESTNNSANGQIGVACENDRILSARWIAGA